MSGYNLPDDWSWRAYCSYYGEPDEEPEEDEPEVEAPYWEDEQ